MDRLVLSTLVTCEDASRFTWTHPSGWAAKQNSVCHSLSVCLSFINLQKTNISFLSCTFGLTNINPNTSLVYQSIIDIWPKKKKKNN